MARDPHSGLKTEMVSTINVVNLRFSSRSCNEASLHANLFRRCFIASLVLFLPRLRPVWLHHRNWWSDHGEFTLASK